MTREQHAEKAAEFAHELYDMQDYGKPETMGETIRRVIDEDDYDDVVAAAHHGLTALRIDDRESGGATGDDEAGHDTALGGVDPAEHPLDVRERESGIDWQDRLHAAAAREAPLAAAGPLLLRVVDELADLAPRKRAARALRVEHPVTTHWPRGSAGGRHEARMTRPRLSVSVQIRAAAPSKSMERRGRRTAPEITAENVRPPR